MVTVVVTEKKLAGSGQADNLTGIVNILHNEEGGQIHVYALGGDDVINLDFSNSGSTEVQNPISKFTHGHHVRAEASKGTNLGNDEIHFNNINNVVSGGVVVGRLEDFDSTRDDINIEGDFLDFEDLPSNVRIVKYVGEHNDSNPQTQQWLLIETSTGGYIFYALEGARVDMTGNGGSNSDNQEYHFLQSAPNFASLQDVAWVDPQNTVPDGVDNAIFDFVVDDDDNAGEVFHLIEGDGGRDAIAAGLNDDTVDAHGGDDMIWGGTGHDTLYGGSGHDEIWGGRGADELYGEAGADILHGGQGDDIIEGAGGFDNLWGEDGNDQLDGGGGNDFLSGGAGQDILLGGGANDTLNGGSNHDTLEGGTGDDILNGGSGDDRLEGEAGDDELNGGAGEDTLLGGKDDDVLKGNQEDDKLYGGSGNDTLYGGGGSDQLIGGGGNDDLFGGNASDTFVFAGSNGVDTVKDFQDDTDILLFSEDLVGSSDPKTAEHYLTYASVVGGDIVFDFGNGDLIVIEGYTDKSLLADDIAFF